jgi:hypothetical protein
MNLPLGHGTGGGQFLKNERRRPPGWGCPRLSVGWYVTGQRRGVGYLPVRSRRRLIKLLQTLSMDMKRSVPSSGGLGRVYRAERHHVNPDNRKYRGRAGKQEERNTGRGIEKKIPGKIVFSLHFSCLPSFLPSCSAFPARPISAPSRRRLVFAELRPFLLGRFRSICRGGFHSPDLDAEAC